MHSHHAAFSLLIKKMWNFKNELQIKQTVHVYFKIFSFVRFDADLGSLCSSLRGFRLRQQLERFIFLSCCDMLWFTVDLKVSAAAKIPQNCNASFHYSCILQETGIGLLPKKFRFLIHRIRKCFSPGSQRPSNTFWQTPRQLSFVFHSVVFIKLLHHERLTDGSCRDGCPFDNFFADYF